MPKLPILSGEDIVKILKRGFGFEFVSQKGSHIKLRRNIEGKIITTVVPNHKELMTGTLRGVLDLAKISAEDFVKYYEEKF
ncbi:MAG TPA: type II toxin-antitoxin system HicA family toxin [Patescibacteria group bacterium]|nr:type II toxin-antitoxin system HicA family toxin [Patescibacteria group bacterium]